MRKILICGNWKMHKYPPDTTSFFDAFRPLMKETRDLYLPAVPRRRERRRSARGSKILVGAQDLYRADNGAFTGEVSGPIIKASGCSHVFVGHSERRRDFGETDATVLRKTIAALEAVLTPIVCVGERDEKDVEDVLADQFLRRIGGLSDIQFAAIVIGYGLGFGDGRTATPEEAVRAHALIRVQANSRYGANAADGARILYGGSVKAEDAKSLLAQV